MTAQSSKSFPLGVSDHKWYPYQFILWSSKHSLRCFRRICRFSLQTCFALMVCTESNPVVLSRGGETCRHRCFVLVCIRRKTQGLVGFYRVSSDADRGQIWNCRQSEGTLGGEGIFSLSLFVRSMVSQYFPFWSNTFHSQVSVQYLEEWEVQLGFSFQLGFYPSSF